MPLRGASQSKLVYGKMPGEVVFDRHGDLILDVNETESFFHVCSRTLARASPIFDNMLYGGFAENQPLEEQWVVHLPDEKVYGLHILLDIMHGNTHNVKKDIFEHAGGADKEAALELLSSVAITADKYDIVHLFSSWAEPWLHNCSSGWYWSPSGWHGKLIWASWVFGDGRRLLHQLEEVLHSAFIAAGSHGGYNVERRHRLQIKNYRGDVMPLYHPEGNNQILNFLSLGKYDTHHRSELDDN